MAPLNEMPILPVVEVPAVEAPIPPVEPPAPTRRRLGRPPKWFPPTDGTPMSAATAEALRKRDVNRKKYAKDADMILARNRASYYVRKAKKAEMEATLERFRELARA